MQNSVLTLYGIYVSDRVFAAHQVFFKKTGLCEVKSKLYENKFKNKKSTLSANGDH